MEAILFDMDGTLIDTTADFFSVLNCMLENDDRPQLYWDVVRLHISGGVKAMIDLGYGTDISIDEFEHLKALFLDKYGCRVADLQRSPAPRLFPGIDVLLSKIEECHIPWGIVTNKYRVFSIPLIDIVGLKNRCSVLVCSDDVENAKPDPEPLFKACQSLSVTPQNCIYIGDHLRDVESGRNAGMPTVAALYGYIDDDPNEWQADFCVDSPHAMFELFVSKGWLIQ